MRIPKEILLWCDLETTGLDPEVDEILEIAMVITGAPPEFTVLSEFHVVLKGTSNPATWDDYVFKTHSESGLLKEAYSNSGVTIRDARELAYNWLSTFFSANRISPLCGSTPSFDREFIKKHLTNILPFITYRHLDVSSSAVMIDSTWYEERKGKEHRAKSDVYASINVAREWANRMFAPHEVMHDIEDRLFKMVFDECNGSVVETVKRLKVGQKRVYDWMRRINQNS